MKSGRLFLYFKRLTEILNPLENKIIFHLLKQSFSCNKIACFLYIAILFECVVVMAPQLPWQQRMLRDFVCFSHRIMREIFPSF